MAETRTIARPYAQAVFQLAQENDALSEWSEMLRFGAAIAVHPALRNLIGNPRINQAQLTGTILDIAGDRFNEHAANFIRLLVANERVIYLPAIADLFETYRHEADRTVEAHVLSAFPLNAEQEQEIGVALKARLGGKTVTLTQSVDESLIGGVMIRIGDRVIDGSVTGRLDQLTRALMS